MSRKTNSHINIEHYLRTRETLTTQNSLQLEINVKIDIRLRDFILLFFKCYIHP